MSMQCVNAAFWRHETVRTKHSVWGKLGNDALENREEAEGRTQTEIGSREGRLRSGLDR